MPFNLDIVFLGKKNNIYLLKISTPHRVVKYFFEANSRELAYSIGKILSSAFTQVDSARKQL